MKKRKIYYTNLKVKRENFPTFMKLIEDQFNFAGENKYQLQEDKEMTDLVCELVPGDTGVDWVIGTIMKYLGRFKNTTREKDLLKIATYCYIMWLQMGFHLQEKHDKDEEVYKDVQDGRSSFGHP